MAASERTPTRHWPSAQIHRLPWLWTWHLRHLRGQPASCCLRSLYDDHCLVAAASIQGLVRGPHPAVSQVWTAGPLTSWPSPTAWLTSPCTTRSRMPCDPWGSQMSSGPTWASSASTRFRPSPSVRACKQKPRCFAMKPIREQHLWTCQRISKITSVQGFVRTHFASLMTKSPKGTLTTRPCWCSILLEKWTCNFSRGGKRAHRTRCGRRRPPAFPAACSGPWASDRIPFPRSASCCRPLAEVSRAA
mmetsp:Transcript_53692/g.148917  ORF Transcript_53692/g.148917 Transcript_53692/m.148917 type:complete len:247 (+) Transcript_53692:596-1336(+)